MKTKFTLVLSILSGAAWVGAQTPECLNPEADTLFNNVAGTSGGNQSLLWDVKALHDVIIDTMYIEFTDNRESTISIWTKKGIFRGYEQNENAWTQVVSDLVWKTGTITETLFIPFKIEKGATQAFYVYSKGPALIHYSNRNDGSEGSITAENDDLIMYYGIQKYGGWTANPSGPRSLRTRLNYRRCDGATKSPSPGPKTESPTTSAPTTSAPTTSAPTTSAPTTSAPSTSTPTTATPTTSAPTTSVPTSAPTTSAPTTSAPTTSAPSTSTPTTATPTTSAPTTSVPTTSAPTAAPITASPTTAVPTTAAPRTSPAPTKSPVRKPTPGCVDDESFSKNRGGRNRTCAYFGDESRPWRANKWCMKKKNGDRIYNICCKTCKKYCTVCP